MSTLVWRPFLCRIARHSIYMNATPSSSESLKIDEQQLDLYIENIIEATASSLGDIVIRVSSSTKQSDKEFVFEPGGGTPIPAQKYEASLGIDAPSQEVPVQESSDPPVDQPPQSPSSPKPSGKKIKSHWFKWL